MNAPLPNHQLGAPWQALLDGPEGASPARFHSAWMECLLLGVGDAAEAVLVLADESRGGTALALRPVAYWPPGRPCGEGLARLCEEALAMRTAMTRNVPGGAVLAMPLIAHERIWGVVGLAFRGTAVPRHAQDWLRMGAGWLRGGTNSGDAADALRERLLAALDLIMSVLGEEDARAAAGALATEAAARLGCDRVSIGFGDGRSVRLAALSNSAEFSQRLDLARAIEAAMNEACDQGAPLMVRDGVLADASESPFAIVRDHTALTRGFGTRTALSVPFLQDERRYGVMTFEWAGDEVDDTRRQIALGVPPVLGRMLLEKRQAQRAWPIRMADALRVQAERLFGPRYAMRKLVVLALLAVAAFLAVATGDYRVSAKASLEGEVRRALAAPFDGFVASAASRAGQVVAKGQVLATLDDRELKLETERWASQQTQYAKQMQDAQAQHNLAQMQITIAQANQAAAQRRLSESMVNRTRVEAPFAGVIVSGDLSQNLGSAVRKGQTLFEIAPLDSYRVILEVDEADVGQIEPGQAGELMVTGLPGQTFPFTVRLVTPVAHVGDGRNLFRIEASVDQKTDRLRPGMEGIGKVLIGERKQVWIWTHRMTDWLRLQAWNWFGV